MYYIVLSNSTTQNGYLRVSTTTLIIGSPGWRKHGAVTKSKVYELTYKLLSTVNISKNNFRPRRWQSLSERGSDKRYEEREVNWQNQLWVTFHTTPRGQSCELLGTYLSWMIESRSWRLARKIPPYERLAQDTQCKIELLRLIRGEIQRVYVLHENFEVKLWVSDCVCILGKLNASSHWSNLEVWRRCVHNHGYWNELFQPSRRDTSGGKILTRVFASTASDG